MNATASKLESENITPAVHLEFIQNHLESADPTAPAQVEEYHRALFLHHHAIEWEKFRQQARIHEDRLAFLEGRLKATQLALSERPKLVPASLDGEEDLKPGSPWNVWDVTMLVVSCLGILSLLTFGVLNISFNLLESGFITFRENPFRSYLWAALLPVGALAAKVGWDCLKDRQRRDVYLWTCLALGMLGVLVWVGAYACVYPTLSKGIDDHIAALTLFDRSASAPALASRLDFAGAKWVNVITLAAQAVAEIFISALLGIYLTNLYARHRPVRLAQDPAFSQLDAERRNLEASVERERLSLGEATGNLVRLENQLSALIAYGKSLVHRETARRQDRSEKRQIILDQLSEHLRQHIDETGTGNRLPPKAPASALGGNHRD